jgi:hypothetical protein
MLLSPPILRTARKARIRLGSGNPEETLEIPREKRVVTIRRATMSQEAEREEEMTEETTEETTGETTEGTTEEMTEETTEGMTEETVRIGVTTIETRRGREAMT